MVADKRRLAQHTALTAIGQTTNLFPFLLWLIAAQRLGPDRFGLFSFALAFSTLFQILADLGTRDYVANLVARDRRHTALAGRVLTWRLGLTVVVSLVIMALFELTDPSREGRLVLWAVAPFMCMRTLRYYLRAMMHGVGRFGIDTVLIIADRVMMVGAGLAALFLHGTPLALACGLLLARTVDILVTTVTMSRTTGVRPGLSLEGVPAVQKLALPLGLFHLITDTYAYADQIMIGLWREQAEIGLYAACYKVHEGATLLPAILAAPALPALSAAVLHDTERACIIARRVTKYALLAALGLTLVVWVAAGEWIQLLFGSAYLDARTTFVVLTATAAFTFPLMLMNKVLVATQEHRAMARLAAVGLGLNLALNVVLIPRFGYQGAAWATFVGEAAVLGMAMRVAARALPNVRLLHDAWRPLTAFGVAAAAGFWLRTTVPLPHLAVAGTSLLVFAALLFAVRAIDRADVDAVRLLVTRERPTASASS